MRDGRRTDPPEPLETLRQRLQDELPRLDIAHRRLTDPEAYPVEVSRRLQVLQRDVRRRVVARELAKR